MSSPLLLSVTLLVAIVPGLQAGSLLERGMLTAATKDPLCNDQLTSCDGCNQIRNCVKIKNTYYNTGRPTVCGSNTPWCSEKDGAATCVATLPADSTCNKPKTADFVCTQSGYFPDMRTCDKYYVCMTDPSTGELVAHPYDCSAFPGANYDAATGRCKLTNKCYKLSCPHPDGADFELWVPAPWIYATCLDNDPRNALFSACPKGQSWDGEDCVQACHEEGRFAALSDTTGTKYIECVPLDGNGRLGKPILGDCPVGSKFSAAKSICV